MSVDLYKVQKNTIKRRETGEIIRCFYVLVRMKDGILDKYYIKSRGADGYYFTTDNAWSTEYYEDAVNLCDRLNKQLIETDRDYEFSDEIVYEGKNLNEK